MVILVDQNLHKSKTKELQEGPTWITERETDAKKQRRSALYSLDLSDITSSSYYPLAPERL